MGKRSLTLSVFLLLIIGIIQASEVRIRIDEKGRKVFYNIRPPSTSASSAGVYYSNRVEDYWPLITETCGRHSVDAELVKAVIQVESNYNHRAVSPKGAMGLMQLMPATAARYGVKKAFDPKENVEGGVRYLRDLLDLFGSDLKMTLAAYNAGERAVQKYNGIPNYTETQNYVRKVLALYNGESSYAVYSGGGQGRLVSYYKHVDEKGVTHYSSNPVSGIKTTKVSFYY